MSNAVAISGSTYTVTGTVKDKINNEGIADLHVIIYDKDILENDFLGIGVTDANGTFSVSFDASKFATILEWWPDLYFVVRDAGHELLNTKDQVIENADTSTPPINLLVDLSDDKLREEINESPATGWGGGFAETEPAFAYPTPDLSSLSLLGNLENIDKLQRQQKVLWPEFSWNTEPDEDDKKRCYQMFDPDISRLGYTNEGRVYSIICPQQGASSPRLGSMNVEVTVTGNRGWVDETNKELAGDMEVEGRIWFSPSAKKGKIVRLLLNHFKRRNLPFPSDKASAIVVKTFKPGHPDQAAFPFSKGLSTDFPIPEFATHTGVAWSRGHLGVQIGSIKKTEIDVVDKFNQLVVNLFNLASGNMLKEGNVLTWNVWFTAPEVVDQEEWAAHAEKWRQSIHSDHGSPEGPGTEARYFDGTPFKPLNEFLKEELPAIIAFIKANFSSAS